MQFLVIGRQLRRPEHFTMAVFVEATPVETTEANAHLLKWTIIISFFFCFFFCFLTRFTIRRTLFSFAGCIYVSRQRLFSCVSSIGSFESGYTERGNS